jgi:hypothetical protein
MLVASIPRENGYRFSRLAASSPPFPPAPHPAALPPGVAFDEDGNPTVDGRAAARGGVSAFGGHKCYGLAFAIQALGLLAALEAL